MTTSQRIVLNHFDRKNLGAIFHDRRSQWVWRADVRDDATLADEIVNDRAADLRNDASVFSVRYAGECAPIMTPNRA